MHHRSNGCAHYMFVHLSDFVCGNIFYIMPFNANKSVMYYAPVCVIHFVLIIASRESTRGLLDVCLCMPAENRTNCVRNIPTGWLMRGGSAVAGESVFVCVSEGGCVFTVCEPVAGSLILSV